MIQWLVGFLIASFGIAVILFKKYYMPKDMPSIDNDPIVDVPVTPPVSPEMPLLSPVTLTNSEKFVSAAKACLGMNLSTGTGVPYYVACAISVNKVHQEAFGFPIGGGASTQELYNVLTKYPSCFKQVDTPSEGCVVISPTGYGSNPDYPHGHVGIVGKYGICSNDSDTGIFSENYTIKSWEHQFVDVEGYPIYWFQRI